MPPAATEERSGAPKTSAAMGMRERATRIGSLRYQCKSGDSQPGPGGHSAADAHAVFFERLKGPAVMRAQFKRSKDPMDLWDMNASRICTGLYFLDVSRLRAPRSWPAAHRDLSW